MQKGPAALRQCPLEAILDYDMDALKALRHLLEKEMALLVRSPSTLLDCRSQWSILHFDTSEQYQEASI